MINNRCEIFYILFYIINSVEFYFPQKIDSLRHLETFEKRTSNFLVNEDFLKSNKYLQLTQERFNETIDKILEGETINYLKHYGPEVYQAYPQEEEMHNRLH